MRARIEATWERLTVLNYWRLTAVRATIIISSNCRHGTALVRMHGLQVAYVFSVPASVGWGAARGWQVLWVARNALLCKLLDGVLQVWVVGVGG